MLSMKNNREIGDALGGADLGPEPSAKRALIIEHASRLFMKKGYSVTSLEQVAKSAGVSKMTIYRHFNDKKDLFVETINRNCARIYDLSGYPPALTRLEADTGLRKFGTTFIKVVTSPEVFHLYRMLVGEMNRFPELGAKFYDAGPARSLPVVQQILSGLLDHNEAEKRANGFLHIVLGDAYQSYMLGRRSRREAMPVFKQQLDTAVNLVLCGVLAVQSTNRRSDAERS